MKQGQITNFFKNDSKKKVDFKLKNGSQITPNEEQEKIIYENKETHMQIKACAGSGKTTTILCRVKYLIEVENVNPSKILITAFNVDAAKNVKQKLNQLISEKIEKLITVNNIDKLSKMWVTQAKQFDVNQLYVKEYTTKLVQLMKNDKSFRDKITKQFDYIFFDEFQDINPDEYEMLKIFAEEDTKITFIGDDAQNIYGFRETKLNNSAEAVNKDFPEIKRHFLTINYRSTDQIVQFANQIITSSKKEYGYTIEMSSHPPNNIGNHTPPDFTKYMSINEQNESIISHILELVESGYTFDQIAVLSRTNKPLQFLEEALEIYNSQKTKASKANEKTNINNEQHQGRNESHNENIIIPFVAHISDNKEKNTKLKFTVANNSLSKAQSQKVTLTTIHKSKGLEWDVVFLIGLNDDYFPGTNKEKEEEEERRVFYVAITRAKKKLLMSFVWSKNNQNMTRFIAQTSTKFYTGYTQPWISEQQKCNEKMRTIDRIKSKSVVLTEIIEFLTKDHYENLRNQGCLEINKENMQIHFKCKLGQYIIENNLVPEFATFFKCYLIRSIGEEYIQIVDGNHTQKQLKQANGKKNENIENNSEENSMVMAFNSKYCSGVLFSEASFNNVEHHEVDSLLYSVDQNLLSTQYIQDTKKRDEIFQSLIQFKDRRQASDQILKSIYNVSMCQSIYNQRRRLLHKEEAFKHFEMNKNILKNGKKAFIPEVLKTATKDRESPSVNETIYDEEYQVKADYDIITEDTIFEIKFQQQQNLKPEEIIELLAKAWILQSAWKTNKIKQIIIYYPLQGEMTTLNIANKQLNGILKVLYQARQDKQEACSVASASKSYPSSNHDSQLLNTSIQSQPNSKLSLLNNQAFKSQYTNQFITQTDKEEEDDYSPSKQQTNPQNQFKPQQQQKSLYKYNNYEGEDEDLIELNYEDYCERYEIPFTKNQFKEMTQKMSFKSSISQSSNNSQLSFENSNFQIKKKLQFNNHRSSSLDENLSPNKDSNIYQNQGNNNNSSSNLSSSANFGFVKASDIANIKSTLQSKKTVTAQQKCIKSLEIPIKPNASVNNQPQQVPSTSTVNPTTAFLRQDQNKQQPIISPSTSNYNNNNGNTIKFQKPRIQTQPSSLPSFSKASTKFNQS